MTVQLAPSATNIGFVLYDVYIDGARDVCLDCPLDDCDPHSADCPLHGVKRGHRVTNTYAHADPAVPLPDALPPPAVRVGWNGCATRRGHAVVRCPYYDDCAENVQAGGAALCERIASVWIGETRVEV